jgi:hypothetical protein
VRICEVFTVRHPGRRVGKAEHLFSPKRADQFWVSPSFLLKKDGLFSQIKAAEA